MGLMPFPCDVHGSASIPAALGSAGLAVQGLWVTPIACAQVLSSGQHSSAAHQLRAPGRWSMEVFFFLWGYVMIDLVEMGLMKAWNRLSLRTARAATQEMLSMLLGIHTFVRLESI